MTIKQYMEVTDKDCKNIIDFCNLFIVFLIVAGL